jgi:hypothetical protein
VAPKWSSVRAISVAQAREEIASRHTSDKTTGIAVFYRGRSLAAKEVLKIAYRLANGLDDASVLNFSSGNVSIAMLRRLAFKAKRLGSASGGSAKSADAAPEHN